MNKYRHLSFRERQKIEDWLIAKKSMRWIGKQLGRSVSSISREVSSISREVSSISREVRRNSIG